MKTNAPLYLLTYWFFLGAFSSGCNSILGITDLPPVTDDGGASGGSGTSSGTTSGATSGTMSGTHSGTTGTTGASGNSSATTGTTGASGSSTGTTGTTGASGNSSATTGTTGASGSSTGATGTTGASGSSTGTTGTTGASGSSTGTTGSSGSGGDAGIGATCSPGSTTLATYPGTVQTGAIRLSSDYQSLLGTGGYAYAFGDPTSTACNDSAYLCVEGRTAPVSTTVYGAGLGVNLNQAVGASAKGTVIVPAADTGISYALAETLSAAGVTIIIDGGGTDYCAPVTATSGTVPWSSFFTCTGAATVLAGAPDAASHIQIQVSASVSPLSFDFCVTALSFTSTTIAGSVPVGGACGASTDCDQSICDVASDCVDWNDGNGPICQCSCSTGADCASGCCWSVNSGAYYACRAGSACEPIYGACNATYQCLQKQCGTTFQSYCGNSSCRCGCSTSANCASGCCTTFTSNSSPVTITDECIDPAQALTCL